MNIQQGFPQKSTPIVDPGTGVITQPWYQYLLTLFVRTGAGSGDQVGPLSVVPLTASPFLFTAPSRGALIVAGGGVSQMTYSRGGGTFYPVGSFYGSFPMAAGDLMRIVFPGSAPSVEFAPF